MTLIKKKFIICQTFHRADILFLLRFKFIHQKQRNSNGGKKYPLHLVLQIWEVDYIYIIFFYLIVFYYLKKKKKEPFDTWDNYRIMIRKKHHEKEEQAKAV